MPPNRDPRKIGASDVVAITGLSRYASAYSVFLRITGKTGWDNNSSRSAEWGHGVEDAILDFYEQENKVKFVRQITYEHPKHEWAVATPDGVDREYPVCVDAKNVADYDRAYAIKSFGLGDDFKVQGIWQMAIYNAWAEKQGLKTVTEAVFYCVLNGNPPEEFIVPWDDHVYEKIEQIIIQFRKNCLRGIPPETPYHKNLTRELIEYFGTTSVPTDKSLKPADDEAIEYANILKELLAYKAEIDEAVKFYEAKVCLKIGQDYGLDLGDGRKIIWPVSKGRASYKDILSYLMQEYKIPRAEIEKLKEKFRGKPSRKLDKRKL